jgi:hypothetical protein
MALFEHECATIHHWPETATLHVEWHIFHKSDGLREVMKKGLDLVAQQGIST